MTHIHCIRISSALAVFPVVLVLAALARAQDSSAEPSIMDLILERAVENTAVEVEGVWVPLVVDEITWREASPEDWQENLRGRITYAQRRYRELADRTVAPALEQQFRDVADRFQAAWDAHDVEQLNRLFHTFIEVPTPDSLQAIMAITDSKRRGAQAIMQAFRRHGRDVEADAVRDALNADNLIALDGAMGDNLLAVGRFRDLDILFVSLDSGPGVFLADLETPVLRREYDSAGEEKRLVAERKQSAELSYRRYRLRDHESRKWELAFRTSDYSIDGGVFQTAFELLAVHDGSENGVAGEPAWELRFDGTVLAEGGGVVTDELSLERPGEYAVRFSGETDWQSPFAVSMRLTPPETVTSYRDDEGTWLTEERLVFSSEKDDPFRGQEDLSRYWHFEVEVIDSEVVNGQYRAAAGLNETRGDGQVDPDSLSWEVRDRDDALQARNSGGESSLVSFDGSDPYSFTFSGSTDWGSPFTITVDLPNPEIVPVYYDEEGRTLAEERTVFPVPEEERPPGQTEIVRDWDFQAEVVEQGMRDGRFGVIVRLNELRREGSGLRGHTLAWDAYNPDGSLFQSGQGVETSLLPFEEGGEYSIEFFGETDWRSPFRIATSLRHPDITPFYSGDEGGRLVAEEMSYGGADSSPEDQRREWDFDVQLLNERIVNDEEYLATVRLTERRRGHGFQTTVWRVLDRDENVHDEGDSEQANLSFTDQGRYYIEFSGLTDWGSPFIVRSVFSIQF